MQNKNNKKSMLKQNTETLTPNRKYKDTMFAFVEDVRRQRNDRQHLQRVDDHRRPCLLSGLMWVYMASNGFTMSRGNNPLRSSS